MTPVPAAGARPAAAAPLSAVTALLLVPVVPEQLLDPAPLLLQPVQRQAKVRDRVPDRVVGLFAVDPHQQPAPGAPRLQATRGQFRRQRGAPLVHLDQQHLAHLGEAGHRVRAEQLAAVDDDKLVADLLDLPLQVRGDHDRDAELRPDPADQVEHRTAPGGVQADGRLVEQQQPGIPDEGLGQLDPLLHPGGVGADLPVPLLVHADVAQRFGGPFLRGGGRQPRHAPKVGDELGPGDVGRQAVVLGHVPGERPDPLPAGGDVVAEHDRPAAGRREQAEQDLDQRRLAGPVRADQPGDAGLDVDGEAGQRRHVARVPLGQRVGPDDGRGGARVSGSSPSAQFWWCGHGDKHDGPRCPASSSSGRDLTAARDQPGSLRPGHDAPDVARRYGESVSAEPGRPPLSMRFNERAWARLDWAVAAVCAVLVYGVMVKGRGIYLFPLSIWLAGNWIPPVLAVIVALPVGLRRRDPPGALILALAGCSVIVAVGGEINRGPFLPLALVLFTVAATCKRSVAVTGLIASLALLVVEALILSFSACGSGPAIGVALILIIVWMVGISAQQRRSYTARVREQVATTAVTEERLRIARELHDVVAHSMTVVAVQAGFGEYVLEHEPGEAKAALGAIQRATREALADMQRLLGVLRQGEQDQGERGQGEQGQGGAAPAGPGKSLQLAPAPGLADLDRLVVTTAGAGVRVDVTSAADRPGIPAAIDQAAFRIVQEALTNVVKHSGAQSCQVTVGCHDGDLCVEITDPGGHGRTA